VVEATLRPLTCGADDLISTSAGLPSAILILAEAHRRAGRFTLAQADLDNARRLVAERGLRHMQADLLKQQAAQFAAMDRFREAYETFVASHEVSIALQSAQRDAQARTLHAVFEATEARQASEHFREMAYRDALTGLYNRRYIDDRLPALLGEAVAFGRPLAVAIVDLDHFKRINDTLSHQTGDQVLQQVGQLLVQATAAQGFAARLGGEEFLVVLPNTGLNDAVRQFERLRDRISSHHWRPVTGALPVTASIGAAATREGESTQSDMLARADRNLYAAKHGGRDRVIAD
jgi:diguanylate cyclase (GGDEF)-like protein